MAGNGPMFDLEDCEDVELIDNKTSSDKFVKAKNTKKIRAKNNESALSKHPTNKSWHETAWGKIIIGLVVGSILLVAKLTLS